MQEFILYLLLFLSLLLNFLMFFRIKYLREEKRKLKSSARISSDEMKHLKRRVSRFKRWRH